MDNTSKPEYKEGRSTGNWLKRFLSVSAVLLLLFYLSLLLIQYSFNQSWSTSRISRMLSNSLGTEVSFDSLELDIFSGLELKNLLIRDHHQDTLIFADVIRGDLFSAIEGLLKKELNVSRIHVSGGLLNMIFYEGEDKNNIGKTFEREASENPDIEKKPIKLNLSFVHLDDFEFRHHDYYKRSEEFYYIPYAEIGVENIDFRAQQVDLGAVIAECPEVYIHILEPEAETSDATLSGVDSVVFANTGNPLKLNIQSISLKDGTFKLDNDFRSPEWNQNQERVNYDHLSLENVNIDVNNFTKAEKAFTGQDLLMSFESPFGFVLEELKVDQASVDTFSMQLLGMNLRTPTSSIGDTLVFKYNCYEAWRDFNNAIFIESAIQDSYLSFRDIMTMAPVLYDNTFFINSENQVIDLDGLLYGRINSLKGREMKMQVGSDIVFRGDLSTRDLAVKNEELLGLKIDELKFDIQSLENLIPRLDLPANFEKLGDISYRGRFDGYFLDFVTYGTLNSNLGSSRLDMRLDLKPGRNKANYSGALALNGFDLATWAGNSDLGILDMSMTIEEGKGLNFENAYARVDGTINHLEYKDYTYSNVTVDGELTRNLFDGTLVSDSEDARFQFKGKISGLDSIPEFRFKADFDQVRLKELNLSEKQMDFGGQTDISLTGLKWEEQLGNVEVSDAWVVYDDQDTLDLDKIVVVQHKSDAGRRLKLYSDFGQIALSGQYHIPEIHQDFINIIGGNHKQLSELLGIDSLVKTTGEIHDYSVLINLNQGFNLINYFTSGDYSLGPIDVDAHVNSVNESIQYTMSSNKIKIGHWDLLGLDISLINNQGLLIYELEANSVHANQKPFFDSIRSVFNMAKDSGVFLLSYEDPRNILDRVNVEARITPAANQVTVNFEPSSVIFGDKEWVFSENNSLTVKKRGLLFENFEISSGSEYLTLDDLNEGKGLEVAFSNFSSDVLDSLTHIKIFDFSGRLNASLEIQNLFDFKGIDFYLRQEELYINETNYGALEITAKGNSLKDGVYIDVDILDKSNFLIANGKFQKTGQNQPAEYEFDIRTENLPLAILEEIIKSGISGTRGEMNAEVEIIGKGRDFDLLGSGRVYNGHTKVDYLGTDYYFHDQEIIFDDDFIDFTYAEFTDSLGNTARIDGGLGHKSLQEWYMDLTITSPRLIGLNTTKADNPSYYGFAIGAADIDFYGTFERPFIDVNATTASPSSLFIPVIYGENDVETGFVNFVKIDTNTTEVTQERELQTLQGIELDMKLSITEAAKISIIFDEQAGDILEGYGHGNMYIKMARSGDMSVYGDYEIERGDYLFTLLNFVNKPFIVNRGGRIRWTGDPIDAQIDLEAEYKGLTASPYPLIQEYTQEGTSVREEARRSTPVDLKMGLKGSLLAPLISFDIALPDLQGELKSYVDNKLQTLRNDQEALNRQVFGLVVFGGFFPSQNESGLVNNLSASTVNTLSEFLSSQLSSLVSTLLNDVVDDVQFISGIDVDLAYIQQYEYEGSQPSSFADGEYQFKLRNRLWDDKWVITIGGNYGSQSVFNSNPYFNPETVIEWNTPVNGLKLRVYYKAEQSFQGQRQRVGGGINYRKEFDSFLDFRKALREKSSGKSEN